MITDQAFVLHKRAYKDSSQLIKLLTLNHGIIDVIAKGSLRPKSKLNGQLQPFIQAQVNLYGKSELKTLTDSDQSTAIQLKMVQHCGYKHHVSRLYCNELLTLIDIDEQAYEVVFNSYKATVEKLQSNHPVRLVLRRFEWLLCCQLGYELQVPIQVKPGDWLKFDPIDGLVISDSQHNSKVCSYLAFDNFIKQKALEKIHLNEISNLMRVVINHLVNGKSIKSRQLLAFK